MSKPLTHPEVCRPWERSRASNQQKAVGANTRLKHRWGSSAAACRSHHAPPGALWLSPHPAITIPMPVVVLLPLTVFSSLRGGVDRARLLAPPTRGCEDSLRGQEWIQPHPAGFQPFLDGGRGSGGYDVAVTGLTGNGAHAVTLLISLANEKC